MRAGLRSLLGWWETAGVDTLVDEAPRDWLRAREPAAAPAPPAPPEPATANATTLATLREWIARSADIPGDPPAAARVAAQGDPAAGLMILVDMPEDGDAAAGTLVSGGAGRLLDAMLAAIGRDRASVYLASVAPARIAGGRLAPGDIATARRHIALAAPRVALVLGDGASAALLGAPVARGRGGLRELNHQGGTVAAMVTFHPRFLLANPARKAEAWSDLRLLLEELARS